VGKALRRITRGLPRIGLESKWKEDVFMVRHLAHTLGFAYEQLSVEVWPGKAGHFVPGIVISSGAVEHAFTLADVPGLMKDAQKSWKSFLTTLPRDASGACEKNWFSENFFASIAAKPETCEALISGLKAAGIAVPNDPENLTA